MARFVNSRALHAEDLLTLSILFSSWIVTILIAWHCTMLQSHPTVNVSSASGPSCHRQPGYIRASPESRNSSLVCRHLCRNQHYVVNLNACLQFIIWKQTNTKSSLAYRICNSCRLTFISVRHLFLMTSGILRLPEMVRLHWSAMKTRSVIILSLTTPTKSSCQAPPQLWKLEPFRSNTVRLTLLHTYMPKVSVDFAGPSYFGGMDDELVLCAGKGFSNNSQSHPSLSDSFASGGHPYMASNVCSTPPSCTGPRPRRRLNMHCLWRRNCRQIHLRNWKSRRGCEDLDDDAINYNLFQWER